MVYFELDGRGLAEVSCDTTRRKVSGRVTTDGLAMMPRKAFTRVTLRASSKRGATLCELRPPNFP